MWVFLAVYLITSSSVPVIQNSAGFKEYESRTACQRELPAERLRVQSIAARMGAELEYFNCVWLPKR